MHLPIYTGLFVIIIYLFIRKDLKNYRYAKKCFKLIAEDTDMKRKYHPRVTRLGVMYVFSTFPKDTPETYINELIQGQYMLLDEALMMMNLDGVVVGEKRYLGENDKEQIVYLVKFVPTFQKMSFWFFIKGFVIGAVGYYLINKFGLWIYVDQLLQYQA